MVSFLQALLQSNGDGRSSLPPVLFSNKAIYYEAFYHTPSALESLYKVQTKAEKPALNLPEDYKKAIPSNHLMLLHGRFYLLSSTW